MNILVFYKSRQCQNALSLELCYRFRYRLINKEFNCLIWLEMFWQYERVRIYISYTRSFSAILFLCVCTMTKSMHSYWSRNNNHSRFYIYEARWFFLKVWCCGFHSIKWHVCKLIECWLEGVWLSFGTYTTFNNISVISWRSVLKVEETGVPGENPLFSFVTI